MQVESLVLPAMASAVREAVCLSVLLTPFSRGHTELCSDTALTLGFSSSWGWVEAAWSASCRSLFVWGQEEIRRK